MHSPTHDLAARRAQQFAEHLARDKHHRPEAFLYATAQMFRGVRLAGARVLEIGSGRGLLSTYVAMQGAASVVGLEPEMVGATSGVIAEQRRRLAELGLGDVVEVVAADFNTWRPAEGQLFDVIVCRAVINHLYPTDRNAATDAEAREAYVRVARHIRSMLAPGGVFIATDATRHSFFGMARAIGIRRPWRRSRSGVNWRHHQNPGVWRSVFESAGFSSVSVQYPVGYPLRALEPLANNALANFFLKGGFILHAHG